VPVIDRSWNGKESSDSSRADERTQLSIVGLKSSAQTETISNWLISKLAERLDLDVREIDPHKDFIDYGLSSIEAVNLSGDLEIFLGRRLPPTLLWDYPNIDALAQALASEGLPPPSIPPTSETMPSTLSSEKTEQLLAELERMPDEEVDALLNSMLSEEEEQG
jgi:acyl carrier protein